MKGCIHCDNVKPILDQLEKESKHGTFHVVRIYSDEYPSIVNAFGIRGYPTLLLWVPLLNDPKDFRLVEYDGPRTFESMNKWILNRGYTKSESEFTLPLKTRRKLKNALEKDLKIFHH